MFKLLKLHTKIFEILKFVSPITTALIFNPQFAHCLAENGGKKLI
jgi:hypothetical protein